VPARVAALVAGVATLVAGAGPEVAPTGPQAARARAGAQASTIRAAGRANRMGRDVSKSLVPEWHLQRSVRNWCFAVTSRKPKIAEDRASAEYPDSRDHDCPDCPV
jgi:hypothetical protein